MEYLRMNLYNQSDYLNHLKEIISSSWATSSTSPSPTAGANLPLNMSPPYHTTATLNLSYKQHAQLQQQSTTSHHHQQQQQQHHHSQHDHAPPPNFNLSSFAQQLHQLRQQQQQQPSHLQPPQMAHQQPSSSSSMQQQQNNSNVANSLLWQPWRDLQQAAAVQQHLYQQQLQQLQKEGRLTSKELPSARWRRERRLRTAEYHTGLAGTTSTSSSNTSISPSSTPPPPPSAAVVAAPLSSAAVGGAAGRINTSMRPLYESTNRPTPPPSNSSAAAVVASYQHNMESPIDMSVSSTTMKHRASPPPPYREPLPGSTYAISLARPSVITQAPSKRERESRDSLLISDRENDNRSTESISMCETVIDEHFRRSLGPNYVSLFGKKSPAPNTTPSPQPSAIAMNTPTPTPPPPAVQPPSQQLTPANLVSGAVAAHHGTPLPPYHSTLPHPQALISAKPTAVLLSPAAMLAVRAESISPQLEKAAAAAVLPPPQQQPLALSTQRDRNTHSPLPGSPLSKTPNSPQSLLSEGTAHSIQPLAAELHSTHREQQAHSPIPSPQNSPHTPNTAVVSSSTPPATAAAVSTTTMGNLPPILRIKAEPGMSTTNTPSASPTSTSSSSVSISTSSAEVIASVDDHFAKALGDTWKKLQEGKEMRK